MQDQKSTILAIVLSAIVLIAWQYFYATPQAEKQRQHAEQQQRVERSQTPPAATPGKEGAPTTAAPLAPGQAAAPSAPVAREKAIEATKRVLIDTPSVRGSISLRGARIDDLALVKYRETVDPKSPAVVLLSPSGTEHPFYAEFGWVPGPGVTAKLPNADTEWKQDGAAALAPGRPIVLTWDNGEGL